MSRDFKLVKRRLSIHTRRYKTKMMIMMTIVTIQIMKRRSKAAESQAKKAATRSYPRSPQLHRPQSFNSHLRSKGSISNKS